MFQIFFDFHHDHFNFFLLSFFHVKRGGVVNLHLIVSLYVMWMNSYAIIIIINLFKINVIII